jgi:hypothetical protein
MSDLIRRAMSPEIPVVQQKGLILSKSIKNVKMLS